MVSLTNKFSFLIGLVSSLYVHTPFGFVSMMELTSFVLGPIFFLMDYQRYNKTARRILFLAILWCLGGILSDLYRGTSFQVMLKGNAIIFNAFTLLTLSLHIVLKSPSALIPFMVGSVLSSVISLYYFQNGSMLADAVRSGYSGEGNVLQYSADKIKYAYYIGFILMGVVFPLRLMRVLPWIACAGFFVICGAFILVKGGGRSSFLIYCSAGGMLLIYAYYPRFLRLLFKRKLATMGILALAAVGFSSLYYELAKRGVLGEEGFAKYESRKAGETTALDNRADLLINWPFLWRSPILGAGTGMLDRWGYVDRSPYAAHFDAVGRPVHHETFFGHSCIVGSWTQCGIAGLIFWIYLLALIFRFLGDRVFVLRDVGPFIIYTLLNYVWGICFSPYGTFRGKVMFMVAFLAMLESKQYQNWVRMAFAKFGKDPMGNVAKVGLRR